MKERTYNDQINIENEQKLRELIRELPRFCREYFIGIEASTSSRTRIAYAYDLGVFFNYLHENNAVLNKINVTDFSIDILEQITPMDIEEYLQYLKFYSHNGKEYTNDERGQMRKLACLRSFYNYFFRKEIIEKNPAALVKMPKQHEKNIVRLDVDEIAILLDEAESGEKLTDRQKVYHSKTKIRDVAILTLLLGTGIRVSECVGLDLDDIDPKNNGIRVHRKGGAEVMVYFGDEVAEALDAYLDQRVEMTPKDGSTEALFLSLQNRRINVRSVENLVKKYSRLVTTVKNITPHKLRSTYGTALYQETGDIYLVADVLGHKDVNTTKKHYAAQAEERRRMAAKAVQLREKK